MLSNAWNTGIDQNSLTKCAKFKHTQAVAHHSIFGKLGESYVYWK